MLPFFEEIAKVNWIYYKFWIEFNRVQAVDPVDEFELACVTRAEALMKRVATYPRIAPKKLLSGWVESNTFNEINWERTYIVLVRTGKKINLIEALNKELEKGLAE